MKIIYAFVLMISFFYQNLTKPKTDYKKNEIIKFLIKNGEIDTANGIKLNDYKKAIYERIVYRKQQKCTISIFGTLSPHCGRYVALEGSSHIILLKTANLTSEIHNILSFLKKMNIDENNLIKILFEVTNAYQYNVKLSTQSILQRPPG